jgi:hypothetical protein
LVAAGRVEDILRRLETGLQLEIEVSAGLPQLMLILQTYDHVDQIANQDGRVRCRWRSGRDTLPSLHRRLVNEGVDLISFAVKTDTLEDIYMRLSTHQTS